MFEDMIDGGNVQDIAEPATQEEVIIIDDPAAEPETAPEGGADDAGQGAETGGEPSGDGGAEPPQSVEERRRNAAMRRQREDAQRQAQLESERRAAQARVDKIIADTYAGQVNPYTGKPILSERDLKEYQEQHQTSLARQQLEKAGLDPSVMSSLVESSPVVQDLRQKLGQMEQLAQRQQQAQGQQLLEQEVRLISAMDPEIRSLDDLFASERAAELMDKVQNTRLSVSEAYKLVYFDKLSGRRAQGARQAAISQAAGKGHLRPQGTGAGGPSLSLGDIPRETVAAYRELNPEMSDSEIIKHYAKHH